MVSLCSRNRGGEKPHCGLCPRGWLQVNPAGKSALLNVLGMFPAHMYGNETLTSVEFLPQHEGSDLTGQPVHHVAARRSFMSPHHAHFLLSAVTATGHTTGPRSHYLSPICRRGPKPIQECSFSVSSSCLNCAIVVNCGFIF